MCVFYYIATQVQGGTDKWMDKYLLLKNLIKNWLINFAPCQHEHQVVICFYCTTQNVVTTHQCAFRPPLGINDLCRIASTFYLLLVMMLWIYGTRVELNLHCFVNFAVPKLVVKQMWSVCCLGGLDTALRVRIILVWRHNSCLAFSHTHLHTPISRANPVSVAHRFLRWLHARPPTELDGTLESLWQ